MRNKLIAALVALACVGALAVALRFTQRLPDGPVPVAWDWESCAHCHMHVGEPGFAAQLHTRDGAIHHFDDPGCLLRFLDENAPDVHALWFHHLREDRWIAGDRVAFVETSPTPMGFGLGAVDAGTPGSINLAAARARVRAEVATEGTHP